ncbi:MAG: carboxy terminal-processing peptidase [Salibacteraceae bacterium]
MKLTSIRFVIATAAAILFTSYILFESAHVSTQDVSSGNPEREKEKVLLSLLIQTVENSHFSPRLIDDKFSKDVFDLYLKRLDFSKRFLLKSDVAKLKAHEHNLDDQIKQGSFEFFDLSYEIYSKRLEEAKSYYKEILSEPFDLTIDETLELDEEKRDFASSTKELKDYWRKILKYQALTRIVEMEEKQEKASESNDTLTLRTLQEMEEKARKSLMKSNDRFFDRIEKWERSDLQEVYINAIMNVYGPHTGYFPPKDKENFDISMSGQLEGIGAQLQEKDGYIKVVNIVPGSASYRQGELEEGDIILKVAQGDEEPVDVTDMRLDDAVKLIRGKKGTEVRLTVKKIDGVIKVISIIRDVVILEETYAKSAIVENETGIRVGYIFVPKFYADFNKPGGGRAAGEDVRKELEKLKGEGVDGVVLDLRGNGGGSLRDAIEMTGHFISSGPVVQVKSRFGRPDIMRDHNSDVTYDGPLVVMMNHFSASASEILAAAIQDYNRGLILGANSSFGKGTVQRFFDLDRMLTAASSEYRPLGAVKVTTQKFYRINGGATQLKGVIPDIVFPDQYNYMEVGEKEQEFVMGWDEIEPANYTPWKTNYNKDLVVANSMKRIALNPVFQKVDERAKMLDEQRKQTLINLNYMAFTTRQKELDKQAEAFENMFEPIENLDIKNLAVDYSEIIKDTVKTELNEKWIKKLKKDQYLNEAIYVISEMKGGAITGKE